MEKVLFVLAIVVLLCALYAGVCFISPETARSIDAMFTNVASSGMALK